MDAEILGNEYDSQEIIEYRKKIVTSLSKMKYPKLGKIDIDKFRFRDVNVKYIEENEVNELPKTIKTKIDDDHNIIVLKDGNIIFHNLSAAFKKVKVTSYFTALKQNDLQVLEIFKARFKNHSDNKLININQAFINSFLYIEVPKNLFITEELKLYIIGEKSDLIHYTLINCQENSELTIVEKLDNLTNINFNYVSEVNVYHNAKLNYVGIDRLNNHSQAFIHRAGYVYDDATLIYALGQLNDCHTISDNIISLIGKNAYCESRNVLFTDKENTHAITINVEHLAPFTVGRIINHGIVKDKGYLYVDGIGKIHQGMKSSNSQQNSRIIILSDDAKVTANPYLLIDEFDVMAGHGAGIGKVSEEQLYYLMSRGLAKKDAEKLIIIGFLYPIIEMISSDKLRNSFIKTIEDKLSI
jgi:Fe-S cluster assembly protein SufD